MKTKICQVGTLSLLNNSFNKSFVITFLVLIFSSCYVFADKQDFYLKATETEMNKLSALAKQHFQENNLPQTEEYAKNLLRKAEYNHYLKGRAEALKILGVIKIRQKEPFLALEQLRKSLFLYEKLQDELEIAKLNNNIGSAYHEMELYEEAIRFYQEALDTYERKNDKSLLLKTYRNIGMAYSELGKYDKAIENYNKNLIISQSLNDDETTAWVYEAIGLCYENQKRYTKSYKYYLQSYHTNIANYMSSEYNSCIEMQELTDYRNNCKYYRDYLTYAYTNPSNLNYKKALPFIYNYNNLGYALYKLGDMRNAIKTLDTAVTFVKEHHVREQITYKIYNNLGEIYLTQKDYKKALSCFKVNESLNINPEDRELIYTYDKLANIYTLLQDTEKAENYTKKKIALETLLNEKIANFRKMRKEKIELIDKTLKEFKTQNASLCIGFNNPQEIGIFLLIFVLFMALFHHYKTLIKS